MSESDSESTENNSKTWKAPDEIINDNKDYFSSLPDKEKEGFRKKYTKFIKEYKIEEEIQEKTRKNLDGWDKEVVEQYADELEKEVGGEVIVKDPDILIEETKIHDKNPARLQKKAQTKKFNYWMYGMALGGIIFLGIMLSLAGVCASSEYCGTETITTTVGNETTTQVISKNIPLEILQSQLMTVFIGTIIGPIIARIMKERFDIQIESSQLEMIMKDAINSVKMYSTEANILRNSQGKLEPEDQRKLRNIAFMSIRENYTPKKYKSLVANLGSQVFEKAIEKAVKDEKIERIPIEKKQIEEIISQAIDATPQIIEWQNLDEDVKKSFIEGNVKRLLSNIRIEGWGYEALENTFDAETNKRLLTAAIADKNKIFESINSEDRYLKYTSIAISAAMNSIGKTPDDT